MAQQPLEGQGLLIIKASWSHTHTQHTRWNSSVQGNSLFAERMLPDNTQHPEMREIQLPLLPAGFEHIIPASVHPQFHALYCTSSGIGFNNIRTSMKGQSALQYHKWRLAPCHTNQYARSPNLSQLKWLGIAWVVRVKNLPCGHFYVLPRFTRLYIFRFELEKL
jgi:hypothetical protein